jgi:hypothetical protein
LAAELADSLIFWRYLRTRRSNRTCLGNEAKTVPRVTKPDPFGFM